MVSQYRSFVTKRRSDPVPEYDDWIQYMVTHYEIQCRPELLRLFRFSSLSLAPVVDVPPSFDVPVPELKPDRSLFQSCIVSLQISYQTVPHVSSFFRDPKVISHVFRLLGREDELLSDKKFSIWNFLKGSNSRRVSLQGKMETGYRKAVLRLERPVVSSTLTTPSVSRTSSVNSSPSPDPTLGLVNVALNRRSSTDQEGGSKKHSSKSSKSKKN